jgi:hypothetical protein
VVLTVHRVGKTQVGYDGLLCLSGEHCLGTTVSLKCLVRAMHAYVPALSIKNAVP